MRGCNMQDHSAECEVICEVAERSIQVRRAALKEECRQHHKWTEKESDAGDQLHNSCTARGGNDEVTADKQIHERCPHQVQMRAAIQKPWSVGQIAKTLEKDRHVLTGEYKSDDTEDADENVNALKCAHAHHCMHTHRRDGKKPIRAVRYSCRKASIGARFAALLAGKIPNITPTSAEKPHAPRMAHHGTDGGGKFGIAVAAINPSK